MLEKNPKTIKPGKNSTLVGRERCFKGVRDRLRSRGHLFSRSAFSFFYEKALSRRQVTKQALAPV